MPTQWLEFSNTVIVVVSPTERVPLSEMMHRARTADSESGGNAAMTTYVTDLLTGMLREPEKLPSSTWGPALLACRTLLGTDSDLYRDLIRATLTHLGPECTDIAILIRALGMEPGENPYEQIGTFLLTHFERDAAAHLLGQLIIDRGGVGGHTPT